jgi:hypothetical protein
MIRHVLIPTAICLNTVAATALAADLQPRTVAAFDRYVRVTESQMTGGPFLRMEGLPESERAVRLAALKRGDLWIDRVVTQEAGKRR